MWFGRKPEQLFAQKETRDCWQRRESRSNFSSLIVVFRGCYRSDSMDAFGRVVGENEEGVPLRTSFLPIHPQSRGLFSPTIDLPWSCSSSIFYGEATQTMPDWLRSFCALDRLCVLRSVKMCFL
eukprot:RCo027754